MKINIGCGTNIVTKGDWINCDNSIVAKLRRGILWYLILILIKIGIIDEKYKHYPKLKIVNIKKKLPFANESIRYIYFSQVLEHLHLYDALNFLKECHRVMKVGGRIRILTPSLEKIIKIYMDEDIEVFKKNTHLNSNELSDHFNLFFYPRINIKRSKIRFLEYLLEKIPEQHKYIYDLTSLERIAKTAGFKKIYHVNTGESNFPDVKILDAYQDVSLMIELEK